MFRELRFLTPKMTFQDGKDLPSKDHKKNTQINLDDLYENRETSNILNTMNKIYDDSELINNLKKINIELWNIEEGKRQAEKNQDFGEKFISLARNVYKINDERAKIKLQINKMLGSNIKEVKSYE